MLQPGEIGDMIATNKRAVFLAIVLFFILYICSLVHQHILRLSPTDQIVLLLDSILVFIARSAKAGIVFLFVMLCYNLMIAILSRCNQRLKFQFIIAAFNFFFLPLLFGIIIEIFDLKALYDD